MGKTKQEIAVIHGEVGRRVDAILSFLADQGAQVDSVRLTITGADRSTGEPVTLRIERDIEEHCP